jgi:hypothetical protein
MSELTIGNRRVTTDKAIKWVSDYTSTPEDPNKPYGYPWYDTYDTGDSPLLVDGDLLAPVLLNVRPSIAAYRSLKGMTEQLNSILREIPVSASLRDTDDLSAIGRLYEPLDDENYSHGVRGTTLAKVLHRKRPNLIPLFDVEIRKCYSTKHGNAAARIPTARNRNWSEYMILLAEAIRDDLRSAPVEWNGVMDANQTDPPITLLRCFDIVAWKCGKSS